MRFRPSLWLTVSAGIAFAILCSLGVWQLQRLEWKEGLIAQIDERMGGEPVPLPQTLDDPDAWRFRPVTVTGSFVHDAESHRTGRPERGAIGYRIFTPLRRADGGGIVMVERGWVPEPLKDPAARPGDPPAGEVTITGIVRLPDPRNTFTPDDDPAANIWFASDPVAMAAAYGLTVPPWYVVDRDSAADWPRAGPPQLSLKNDHLGYAMTWFSLAAVLLVIWLLMGFRRGRTETPQ
ncbi:MAG: SURF1 family protein [Minwuia sp.]|uniref:SURF1 family protein n=1 Tax=Minwuia sp. TaxID=2493630 RepID=UPI003A83BD8F